MDGSKVVWPTARSPFASGAPEHSCSLQRVTVSWRRGGVPGKQGLRFETCHRRLTGCMNRPASVQLPLCIAYGMRRTVQTRRTTPFASRLRPDANYTTYKCAGARWPKSQGGVGLSRHWTGLVCAIPPQFPSPAAERLSPLHHAHALQHVGFGFLNAPMPPLCDLIYVSK